MSRLPIRLVRAQVGALPLVLHVDDRGGLRVGCMASAIENALKLVSPGTCNREGMHIDVFLCG
jgi:hypothetical protein